MLILGRHLTLFVGSNFGGNNLKFLKGAALTKKIQSMLDSNDRADIAIAYWGADALTLLKVKPKRKNVRVVCCLKGGKSDPDIISRFRKRAKQHDRLHAKVVWTPHAAVVGSANASSNGLPEEDFKATGLIEAGVYVDDQATIDDIQVWFKELYYERANVITKSDLEKARLARLLALKTGGAPGTRSSKRSLLELAKTVLASKIDEPVSFAIFRELAPPSSNRGAKRHLAENPTEMQRVLKIQRRDFKNLHWYVNWPNLPKNRFLIDCHFTKGAIRGPSVVQTFHSTKGVSVKTSEGRDDIHFVLYRGKSGFNFRLTPGDARAIRACSKKLWSQATGDNEGRFISLRKAAPILLGVTTR
jgi:hypothetical protein